MDFHSRKNLYDDKALDNTKEYLESKIKAKLTLRKKKLNQEIQVKRKFYLDQINVGSKTKLNSQFKFKYKKFEQNCNQIIDYLNSKDNDFISYALNELRIYFTYNFANPNEQKIIMDTKLLSILLNLGKIFIKEKNQENLRQILWILVNIPILEEGLAEYLNILYSKEFLEFYNDSLIFIKEFEYYTLIRNILDNLISSNYELNLLLLRSNVFSSILDYFTTQNEREINDEILTLKIINYCVDLSYKEPLIEEKDIPIINRCLDILLSQSNTKNEEILYHVYLGISYISGLELDYNFNKKIINEGLTLNILNKKFYLLKINRSLLRIVGLSMRIILNNLTTSDEDCQIIYDNNVIDYYNKILIKFDDEPKILKYVLGGLANISVGKYRNELIKSIIWEEEKIQKYCNLNDPIRVEFIRIVSFLIYNAELDMLKFIYKTKILQYFIYIFNNMNISNVVCQKILKLINNYLNKFDEKDKENEEFKFIYEKFQEMFTYSERINKLDCMEVIFDIEKNLKNHYKN